MTKVLVIGHSHILALRAAAVQAGGGAWPVSFEFLLLREPAFRAQAIDGETDDEHTARAITVDGIDKDAVRAGIAAAAADIAVLCVGGNEHGALGMARGNKLDRDAKRAGLQRIVSRRANEWLDFLMPLLPARVLAYPSPPPLDPADAPAGDPAAQALLAALPPLEPVPFRRNLWQGYCTLIKRLYGERGIEILALPPTVFTTARTLAPDCWGDDVLHGNTVYGKRVLYMIAAAVTATPTAVADRVVQANEHPYRRLPDHSFWQQSISDLPREAVDPVLEPRFRIGRQDQIATAGSCFAQHISKRLRRGGFQFMNVEAEADESSADAQARGYYDFSARFGNIYTARQLLQLFDRAFGYFRPIDRVWPRHGGGSCDPFRPRIEPAGFADDEALFADGRRHLNAVRRMFRQLDVFVFTLGLTECWTSRLDGAVYPVAPGVVGGRYDPERHAFINFSAAEVVADLNAFIEKLKLVNPRARMILTVSPVPLVATASDRHVLVATTYSKAVLRVAAEEIVNRHRHVQYFPSYEIITGPHSCGTYFATDRRSVTEQGVDHVMRLFMAHMTDIDNTGRARAQAPAANVRAADRAIDELEKWTEAACDEEMLRR